MVLNEEERQRVIEEEKLRMAMHGKSPLVAVALSFLVPGLGDLYCGSFIKAFMFFGLDVLGLILEIPRISNLIVQLGQDKPAHFIRLDLRDQSSAHCSAQLVGIHLCCLGPSAH